MGKILKSAKVDKEKEYKKEDIQNYIEYLARNLSLALLLDDEDKIEAIKNTAKELSKKLNQ